LRKRGDTTVTTSPRATTRRALRPGAGQYPRPGNDGPAGAGRLAATADESTESTFIWTTHRSTSAPFLKARRDHEAREAAKQVPVEGAFETAKAAVEAAKVEGKPGPVFAAASALAALPPDQYADLKAEAKKSLGQALNQNEL